MLSLVSGRKVETGGYNLSVKDEELTPFIKVDRNKKIYF